MLIANAQANGWKHNFSSVLYFLTKKNLNMKSKLTCTFLSLATLLFSQNTPPTISNVALVLGANNHLIIQYDLADEEGDAVEIAFRATGHGGLLFDYETSNATGDFGPNIAPGAGKQIQWDFSAYAGAQSDFRIMLVASDNQPLDIQALVDQVDSTRLKDDLTFIEGVRHRTAGVAHLEAVKDFIEMRFQESNLETYRQEFNYGSYLAANIIGRMIGTESEGTVYIHDGHFDTVSNAPGADDNGSAVAGVLEALRILAPYASKKTIKFIGFDLEETGLTGSARYVQSGILPGETIAGVVNHEMIGYYTEVPNTQELPGGFEIIFPDVVNALAADEFRGNFITNVGGGFSSSLANSFAAAAAQYVPDLKVVTLQPSFLIPDLSRSDHASFWQANIPAIMLTDGAEFRNHNYHTPNDKVETINFTFMQNVVKATVATLAELAGVQHSTSWWGETAFFTAADEALECGLHVSPNPVRGEIQLFWGDCLHGIFDVSLSDTNGKVVFDKKMDSGKASSFQIDAQPFAPGLYFLQVKSGQKKWLEKVVVE